MDPEVDAVDENTVGSARGLVSVVGFESSTATVVLKCLIRGGGSGGRSSKRTCGAEVQSCEVNFAISFQNSSLCSEKDIKGLWIGLGEEKGFVLMVALLGEGNGKDKAAASVKALNFEYELKPFRRINK